MMVLFCNRQTAGRKYGKGGNAMKRHIKCSAVIVPEWDMAFIKIVEQTHRGAEFADTPEGFTHEYLAFPQNIRITLQTFNSPLNALSTGTCYMRGRDSTKDNCIIIAYSLRWYRAFCATIAAYNVKFSDSPTTAPTATPLMEVIE